MMGNALAKPSVQQIRWLENERAMFVHLDPSTWTGKEIDDHTANLSDIKLEKLNTDQWCEAALAWGAGAIIFVAKHVGGLLVADGNLALRHQGNPLQGRQGRSVGGNRLFMP